MQKVEEILRAEELARIQIAEARERAAAIVGEACVEAGRLVAEATRDATESAAAARKETLDRAAGEAELIRSSEAEALAAELRRAREGLPEAVAAVLEGMAT